MPSLRDIARRANTSVTTVSLVLNERDDSARISAPTRRHVLEAARALGYTPNIAARRLRRAGSVHPPATIGVLMPFDERLTITVRAAGTVRLTLDAWAREANAGSPDMLIETYRGGHLADVEALVDNARYNGVILFNTLSADDRYLARSGPPRVPLVLVQRHVEGQSWVSIDNHRMGGQVAAHLIALGHRTIAVVTSAIGGEAQAARCDGFFEQLRHAVGVEPSPAQVARGAFSEAGGYEATRRLLQERRAGCPHPTALFVTADIMAIGALYALKEAGLRIPEDVAVVGYDNDPPASFTDPPLTTVDAAIGESTERATRMLLDLIRDRSPEPRTELLDGRLVVRGSCGARRPTEAEARQSRDGGEGSGATPHHDGVGG